MTTDINNSAPKGTDKKPLTGRRVALYIVLFFLTFITVDMYFLYTAKRTHTGVKVDNAYEKGLAYNKVVDAAHTQEKLGWQSEISYQTGRLVATVTDKTGKGISGAHVRAEISRPLSGDFDRTVTLEESQAGQYDLVTKFPAKGQWDVRIYVKWKEYSYQKRQRLIVR